MPPMPASRKFDLLTGTLALAEERGCIALAEAAAILDVSVERLRQLLEPVLYLEFRDGDGELIDQTRAFFLDESDVLQVDSGNWLRDLAATAPSNEGLLRLYIAATVFQATSARPSPTLDRALQKLRQAIAIEMVIPTSRPDGTDTAEEARIRHRSLRFRYVKHKDVVVTDREVLPYDVYGNWGHWFVSGPELGDDVVKQWRIDRMHDVQIGEVGFDPPLEREDHDWFDLTEHLRTVTICVPAHRLAALPGPHTVKSQAVDGEGMVRAEIEVAGDRQLDHLLVALGPGGEVIAPTEYRQRRRERLKLLLEHGNGV